MSRSIKIDPERRAQIGVEKRARTKAVILEAAFRVIGREQGQLARSEEVCKEAGIARATFYTYFSSFEELLAALSYELTHDFNRAVLDYCATLGDPAEEHAAALRYYLKKAAGDHQWGWGMVNISWSGPIFGADTWSAASATIERGISSGIFKVENAEVSRDLLLGTALSAMTTVLRGGGGLDYPEMVVRHTLAALGLSRHQAARIAERDLPEITVPSRPMVT
jgi:AcrR family transcriptional regulator